MDSYEIADALDKYKSLLDSGAISQEEFDVLKAKLFENIAGDNTVHINFSFDGEKVSARLKMPDGTERAHGETYIVPKGQDVNEFCDQVAKIIEHDVGAKCNYSLSSVESQPIERDVREPSKSDDTKQNERDKSSGELARKFGRFLGGLSKEAKIRIVIIAAIVVVAVAVVAFSNRVVYKGDVRGAVSFAQTVGKNQHPIMEVTGYNDFELGTESGENHTAVFLIDGYTSSPTVSAVFDDEVPGYRLRGRITVRGKLMPYMTDADDIYLSDCVLVD